MAQQGGFRAVGEPAFYGRRDLGRHLCSVPRLGPGALDVDVFAAASAWFNGQMGMIRGALRDLGLVSRHEKRRLGVIPYVRVRADEVDGGDMVAVLVDHEDHGAAAHVVMMVGSVILTDRTARIVDVDGFTVEADRSSRVIRFSEQQADRYHRRVRAATSIVANHLEENGLELGPYVIGTRSLPPRRDADITDRCEIALLSARAPRGGKLIELRRGWLTVRALSSSGPVAMRSAMPMTCMLTDLPAVGASAQSLATKSIPFNTPRS